MRCKPYDGRQKILSGLLDIFHVDNLPLDQLFVKLMSAQNSDIIKPVVQFNSTAYYTIRDNVTWLRCMLCVLRWMSLTYMILCITDVT